jgi:hypothetical protein
MKDFVLCYEPNKISFNNRLEVEVKYLLSKSKVKAELTLLIPITNLCGLFFKILAKS